MADKRKRPTRAWMSAVIAICLFVYAGCYFFCGSSRRQAGPPHRTTARHYENSMARIFVPAAWVEAHVTQSVVKIGVIHFDGTGFRVEVVYHVEPGTLGELR